MCKKEIQATIKKRIQNLAKAIAVNWYIGILAFPHGYKLKKSSFDINARSSGVSTSGGFITI